MMNNNNNNEKDHDPYRSLPLVATAAVFFLAGFALGFLFWRFT